MVGRTSNFNPLPRKRPCRYTSSEDFLLCMASIRQEIKAIMTMDKEASMFLKPKKWNNQPKPQETSIFYLGYKGFPYLVRSKGKPKVAFGSGLERFPIKDTELKIPMVEPSTEIVRRQKNHADELRKEKEDILHLLTLLDSNYFETDTFVKDEERGSFFDAILLILEENTGHLREKIEEIFKERILNDNYKVRDLIKAMKDIKISNLPINISNRTREELKTALRDIIEEYEEREKKLLHPSAEFELRRFPFPVKPNKIPFNASENLAMEPTCQASISTYKPEKRDIFGKQATFGGVQKLLLPTMIRCLPLELNSCYSCEDEMPGDFYFSIPCHIGLCTPCYNTAHQEIKINRIWKRIDARKLATFKNCRHCSFRHDHDVNRTVTRISSKEVIASLRREAYFARYSDKPTAYKPPKQKRATWKKIVDKVHKVKAKKGRHNFKAMETDDLESLEDKTKQEENITEYPFLQSKSNSIEEFQSAEGDKSMQPDFIDEKEASEKEKLSKSSGSSTTSELYSGGTGAHWEMLKRKFGSKASLYATCIPEYREKGAIHFVDPDTESYILCPKGRTFYEKTPLAWEMSTVSDEKLDQDDALRFAARKEVKKSFKLTSPLPSLTRILQEGKDECKKIWSMKPSALDLEKEKIDMIRHLCETYGFPTDLFYIDDPNI